MNLNFLVIPAVDAEPIAAFRFREIAEKWRDQNCDTAVVADRREGLPVLERAFQDRLAVINARRAQEESNRPIIGGDRSHELGRVEADGGGLHAVDPQEYSDELRRLERQQYFNQP